MRNVNTSLAMVLAVLLTVTPLASPRAESSGMHINGHKVKKIGPGKWLVDDAEIWNKVNKEIIVTKQPYRYAFDADNGNGIK